MKLAFAGFLLLLATNCNATSLRRVEAEDKNRKRSIGDPKVLVETTLDDGSTVAFYEPMEGLVSVLKKTPQGAVDKERVNEGSKKAKEKPKSATDLYKLLTGEEDAPQAVKDAETHMRMHTWPEEVTSPPGEPEDLEGMTPANEDDGGRNLVSCYNFENYHCWWAMLWNYCVCMSCRTGRAWRKNYRSYDVYTEANSISGVIKHDVSFWNGNYWQIAAKDYYVAPNEISELWVLSTGGKLYWWADLFDADYDAWNWFVTFYNEYNGGFSIYAPLCPNVI